MLIQQEHWTSWIVARPFRDVAGLKLWVEEQIRRTEAAVYDRAYGAQLHATVREFQASFASGDPTGRGDPTVFVLESGVGLTEMYHTAGMELFSYLLADDPDLVEAWLEARLQSELRRVAAIADADLIPIALTYDDLAYKTGLLFSPH